MSCTACGEDAKFINYRSCHPLCLFGKIVYERPYYYCGHCQSGWHPTDAEFGIEKRQTRGAREVISQIGVLEPFVESAEKVLRRATGLAVSPSTARRTTESVGEDVSRRRAAGDTFGGHPWSWNHDAIGQKVAYVGLDATGVPQQGPRGEKRECRMPWVATVFNPPSAGEPRGGRIWETRYVAGLMSLPEIGRQLRAECQAVDVSQADMVIALTDGGNGLESCLIDALAGIAKETTFILDFYHVSEHLLEFAKLRHPDETSREQQMKEWCHTLKWKGGDHLLADLEALELSRASPGVREGHRQLLGYVRNNLHRMDYPRYIQRGWQIGSGKIESACKTVVGQRLKESGMRWREPGTTALAQLRALYKSEHGLWRNYWTQAPGP